MPHTAVATKEMPRVEVGMPDDRFLSREMPEDPPTPTPVEIDVTIIEGFLCFFSMPKQVEGVSIVYPATIKVTKPNASLNLELTLRSSEYTFESPAILWVNPPQNGYSTNPFDTQPIVPSNEGRTATIPNFTAGLPTGQAQPTPFALILKTAKGHTVVFDPTIVDEPNT